MTGLKKRILIFTDLNDTLLDRNYDFSAAAEALALLREHGIPLIINTSKSRTQTEIYRKKLNVNYPVIVENGGAVYFPEGSFPCDRIPIGCQEEESAWIWRLSREAESLLPELQRCAYSVGAKIEVIYDIPVPRIMELTGMSAEESQASMQREHTLYFLCHNKRDELFSALRETGLKPAWGSYFCHLGSINDKGTALEKVVDLYRQVGDSEVISAAFGDNHNDITMFQAADHAFLVEEPGGGYRNEVDLKWINRVRGVGPIGWNRGVLDFISIAGIE